MIGSEYLYLVNQDSLSNLSRIEMSLGQGYWLNYPTDQITIGDQVFWYQVLTVSENQPILSVLTENQTKSLNIEFQFFGVDRIDHPTVQLALSSFQLTEATSPDQQSTTIPSGWIRHTFTDTDLVVYTPPRWQSNSEYFPNIPSTLLRFWEGGGPENSTIQLNIKNNWDNMGITGSKPYLLSNGIKVNRADPPRMDEKKLDRYQTNFSFEHQGQVYSLLCVHNWLEENIKTCEDILEYLEF